MLQQRHIYAAFATIALLLPALVNAQDSFDPRNYWAQVYFDIGTCDGNANIHGPRYMSLGNVIESVAIEKAYNKLGSQYQGKIKTSCGQYAKNPEVIGLELVIRRFRHGHAAYQTVKRVCRLGETPDTSLSPC